jgi:cell division protein FtsZ
VIFGAVIDESLNEEVRVTVIATGFGARGRRRRETVPATAVAGAPRRIEAPSVTDVEIDIPAFLREDETRTGR